jgi:hypothetical protein
VTTEPIFHFDQYTVRPVGERDRRFLDKLIEADPLHKDCMDADFFLDLKPGEDAWAVEDGDSRVCLYFKTSTAVRLSMLFANQSSNTGNRDLLTKGMAWLEAMVICNKFREIIFDTKGPALAAMAKRRLGFLEAPNGTLVKLLPVPNARHQASDATEGVEGRWHHRPTALQEAG